MSLPQVFYCSACDYRFGPVGVRPFVPDAPTQQLFLVCSGCSTPTVMEADPTKIDQPCRSCGGLDYRGLDACPRCSDARAAWLPAEAVPAPRQVQADDHAPAGPLEVEYAQLGGCLLVVMAIMTLGVVPLVLRSKMRRWPARFEPDAAVLRDGTRIPWAQVQRVEHLTTDVDGTVARKFVVQSQAGSWELPYERVVDAQRAVDYFLARVPEASRAE